MHQIHTFPGAMGMNRRERTRLEAALLFLFGLWHTFDQWCRVLVPFALWQLQPKPSVFEILILNAVGSGFILIGSFLVAQLIESQGLRRTGLICTTVTALYQIVASRITNFHAYMAIQSLLLMNNLPMVVDACIVYLEGEDGDSKNRTRLITRLAVPLSIAFAAGPYIALQVFFMVTFNPEEAQIICGFLHFVLIAPLVWKFIPDNLEEKKSLRMPTLNAYTTLLNNERTRWCLLLLMMVTGPYCAYDQVVRMQLTSTILNNPHNATQLLVLILGGTTVAVHVFLLPWLQARLAPQRVLQLAFGLLASSYLLQGNVVDQTAVLLGMPIQIFGVSICLGELMSQVLSTVGKQDMGRAAALTRVSQLLATGMVPLLTGYYVDENEASMLCHTAAAVAVSAIPLLHYKCSFMRPTPTILTLDGKLE